MRRPAFFFLAFLFALPARAGVVRVPAAAAAGPVAALGSVLVTALPAAPSLLAAAPSPAPSMLDVSKAQALLARAQALPVPLPAAVPVVAAQPLRVLEAVNAALKDFTPGQIRDMPADKLSALASVIMDNAEGKEARPDLAAAVALSEASLAKVERLRGPVTETLHNPGHPESHGDMITSRGVPETVRRYDAEGAVFRHYTTAEGLEAILREKSLRNGFLSYVELARALYTKTYRDLTGIFLTFPKVEGDRVGVPAKEFRHYVDLRVPRGVPVLEVEKGAIFLVPLPARTRGWVADLYRKWVRGEGVNPTYKRSVEEIESEGGPGPSLSMPVEIVGHGRVGR